MSVDIPSPISLSEQVVELMKTELDLDINLSDPEVFFDDDDIESTEKYCYILYCNQKKYKFYKNKHGDLVNLKLEGHEIKWSSDNEGNITVEIGKESEFLRIFENVLIDDKGNVVTHEILEVFDYRCTNEGPKIEKKFLYTDEFKLNDRISFFRVNEVNGKDHVNKENLRYHLFLDGKKHDYSLLGDNIFFTIEGGKSYLHEERYPMVTFNQNGELITYVIDGKECLILGEPLEEGVSILQYFDINLSKESKEFKIFINGEYQEIEKGVSIYFYTKTDIGGLISPRIISYDVFYGDNKKIDGVNFDNKWQLRRGTYKGNECIIGKTISVGSNKFTEVYDQNGNPLGEKYLNNDGVFIDVLVNGEICENPSQLNLKEFEFNNKTGECNIPETYTSNPKKIGDYSFIDIYKRNPKTFIGTKLVAKKGKLLNISADGVIITDIYNSGIDFKINDIDIKTGQACINEIENNPLSYIFSKKDVNRSRGIGILHYLSPLSNGIVDIHTVEGPYIFKGGEYKLLTINGETPIFKNSSLMINNKDFYYFHADKEGNIVIKDFGGIEYINTHNFSYESSNETLAIFEDINKENPPIGKIFLDGKYYDYTLDGKACKTTVCSNIITVHINDTFEIDPFVTNTGKIVKKEYKGINCIFSSMKGNGTYDIYDLDGKFLGNAININGEPGFATLNGKQVEYTKSTGIITDTELGEISKISLNEKGEVEVGEVDIKTSNGIKKFTIIGDSYFFGNIRIGTNSKYILLIVKENTLNSIRNVN